MPPNDVVNIFLVNDVLNVVKYKKALGTKFPEIVIHAAAKEEEVGDFIEVTNVLLTGRISDLVEG